MKSDFFSHNHGNLYYEVTGKGTPIVFVHGFTLDHRMWQPQIDFFNRHGYQVITYDARGFGRSSIPDQPYSHDDDLQALLKHLGVSNAVIVGLSMGGRIAINLTLNYPEVVQSLVLMDSALDGYASEVDWSVNAREKGIEKAKENWVNHPVFDGTKHNPRVITELETMAADYSGWHWLNDDMQDPESTNALERLNEIKVPTLIMVGEKDLAYFHNIADTLGNSIVHAKQVTIQGAGHMINMESAATCNQLILKHITC